MNSNNNTEIKDKRLKREMANSNERRRMQSINAGFQRLKRLLPLDSSEKLSKANILQQAAEFVQQIEREKLLLHEQNTLFRSILAAIKSGTDAETAMDKLDLDALPIISPRIITNANDTSTPSSTASTTPAPAIVTPTPTPTIDTTTTNIAATHPTTATTVVTLSTTNPAASTTAVTSTPTSTPTTTPTPTIATRANPTLILSSPTPNSDLNASAGVAKAAKAAIALPLEVPYTSETATTIDHHHHISGRRKLLKIEPMTTDSPEPGPKGQTLDTICKAILEIEGDRVFKE